MNLIFEEIQAIPKLAWAVCIEKNVDNATVQHGSWVEVSKGFFFEGAWNGDFKEQSIASSILMGSGGITTRDGLLLTCPNHTLDRIYVYRKSDVLLASNSLPFILAKAEDDLDMRFLFYDALLASIRDGLGKYEPELPTRNGVGVRLYYHCNLHISANLSVSERPKDSVREFSDFSDYTRFLEEQISGICANANHPERKVRYSPVTTISSGYDSPACAVMARRVGCRAALTFATARGVDAVDSGGPIAHQLGLQVKTFGRMDYKKKQNFPEVECSGGPSEFSSFDDELVGKLLFVGFHGDAVWDRNYQAVSTSIIRSDASGFGLTELRLRTGFILMAVPFLGCTSHPSIHRISTSDEMRPWCLGNRYDRPIPRRLVEEYGVDRNLFGMKKKASGVYVTEEGIENTLSPESFRDFTEFCQEYWDWKFAAKSLMVESARSFGMLNARASKVLHRVIYGASGLNVKIPVLLPHSLRIRTYGYAGREALLFHWGIRKVMSRYALQ